MPPAELLAANDHVATCEACCQRFGAEDLVAATYTFVRANLQESDREEYDHLVYEQMAAYTHNALSEAERKRLGVERLPTSLPDALAALEVFSLGHRIFISVEYWHRRWKMKAAAAA